MNEENSIIKDDKTLPVDWEASGMLLMNSGMASATSDDTLLEERKLRPSNQPFTSMPDLSSIALSAHKKTYGCSPFSGSSNLRCRSGLLPGRQITQKEYDQQLDELRRDNFNLKLRIHFLLEQLSDSKDAESQDLVKKMLNLQTELQNVQKEVEDKDHMLQDAVSIIRQNKELHAQEIEELKTTRNDDIRQAASAKTIKYYEQCISTLEHNVARLSSENCELKYQLDVKNAEQKQVQSLAESDSDVSLLNDNEKIIMDLKSKIVNLEQQLSEERVAFNEQLKDVEERFLGKESDLVPQFQSTGFISESLLELTVDAEKIDWQGEICSKNLKIADLEDRLKQTITEKESVVRERDDLRIDLTKEQENAIKREKIIQGLLKNASTSDKNTARDQKSAISPKIPENKNRPPITTNHNFSNNDGESSHNRPSNRSIFNFSHDVSALTDPSLINDVTRLDLNQSQPFAGDETRDRCETFRQRIRELALYNDNFSDRIGRVSESLVKLAQQLGGDAGKLLSSFSSDLSRMREDLMDSSILFNQTENEKEINKLNEDLSALNAKLTETEALLHEKDKIIEDVSRAKFESDCKLNEMKAALSEKLADVDELTRQLESMRVTYSAELAKCKADQELQLSDLRTHISCISKERSKEKEALIMDIDRLETALKNQQIVTKEQFKTLKLLNATPTNVLNSISTAEHNLTVLMSPLSASREKSPASSSQKIGQKDNQKGLLLTDETRRILCDQLEKAKQVFRNVSLYIEREKSRRSAVSRSVSTQIETVPALPSDPLISHSLDVCQKVFDTRKRHLAEKSTTEPQKSRLPEAHNEPPNWYKPYADADDPIADVRDFKRANQKLERYAKLLKGKYRRLQSMYLELANRDRDYGSQLRKKLDFDDDLDRAIGNRCRLDEAVRKLEENNEILAQQIEQHERLDEDQYEKAMKYRQLKKKRMAAAVRRDKSL